MISQKESARRFIEAREKNKQTAKQVHEETGISASMISDLESSVGKQRFPAYNYILELAEHYGVNVAWLMGQPDSSPSLDEDEQMVTRVTGLSTKAIDNLRKIKKNQNWIECVNCILESDGFEDMIEKVSTARKINRSNLTTTKASKLGKEIRKGVNSHNTLLVFDELTKDEKIDFFLWSASDILGRITRNIVEKGDKGNGKHNEKD